MKNKIIISLISLLAYSCSDYIYTERQKLYNIKSKENLYLKYCYYSNGHDAILISQDSIYKWPNDSINEYISNSGCGTVGVYFYKLQADTLYIYGSPFEVHKTYPKFKTKIKMINTDVVEYDSIEHNYKKLGLRVFPLHSPICELLSDSLTLKQEEKDSED